MPGQCDGEVDGYKVGSSGLRTGQPQIGMSPARPAVVSHPALRPGSPPLSSSGMSRLGMSGIALPAMACLNRLIFLRDPQPGRLVSLLLGLYLYLIDRGLDPLLNRQVQLSLLLIESPLLPHEFSLCLLRPCQFDVVVVKHQPKLRHFICSGL